MLLYLVVLVTGLLLGAGGSLGVVYYRREQDTVEHEVESATVGDDVVVEGGHAIEFEPIDTRSGIAGLVKTWRRRVKERKLAEKGYVKWLRLDARLEAPQWVKPDYRGTGVGEYHGDDGVTYFFEKEAMVPDARTGAWVALHRIGDADPINLRDAAFPALPADRVEEILNLLAEAEKPGFFDDLDLSIGQTFIVLTIILFIVYAASQVM